MRKKLVLLLAALAVAIIPGREIRAVTISSDQLGILHTYAFTMPTHPVVSESYAFTMPTHPVVVDS